MKIVVTIDSFKGCLSSQELADAAEVGILRAIPEALVAKIPVADGGEGTVDALVSATGGHKRTVRVHDPLDNFIEAQYGILGDGSTAVIEMATASGLPLVPLHLRNPLLTSTRGTGELIADALDLGCRKFIVGIGGSATTDAGTGMLSALGWKFLDAHGNVLDPCGGNLEKIASVDTTGRHAALATTQFLVACDVDNPMYGLQGAAHIFARQKGADDVGIATLDAGLRSFAAVIERETGHDIAAYPGAGAAGALGAGFLAFTNASLKPGIEIVLDQLGFEEVVRDADFVLTGEGRLDAQSLHGKTPIGIARAAQKHGVPTIAIAGSVADDIAPVHAHGIVATFSIMDSPMSLEVAMQSAKATHLVAKKTEAIFRLVSLLCSFSKKHDRDGAKQDNDVAGE